MALQKTETTIMNQIKTGQLSMQSGGLSIPISSSAVIVNSMPSNIDTTMDAPSSRQLKSALDLKRLKEWLSTQKSAHETI